MKTKKILFVVTSYDQVPNGTKTGIWIEEFASPYYLLTAEGIEITIASPKGGKAPIDPKSTKPEFSTESVKRFFSDTSLQEKLNNTVALEDIDPTAYDAVFYPGGHGPMWDLPENAISINIIESFYEAGKPVALVCHAPAALKNVRSQNGESFVKGKKVAGFTNSEEIAGQSTGEVPFMLEDMLVENGAVYQKGADWQSFAVNDGVLITGQNPASSESVAEKILSALKSVQ
ncbi:type 1 glutamine amidotransferase domain-containing protein [Dyadobacter sp. 3J3]|uniref:type 1 glutamine amidotransferase domain-containing protein n=1 Tax=Dyadobacter sp. 3J3 TaxID=2606600 RepID=UPI00190F1FA1|nr:type 1 glutamine amidotransferase domain-containing protein [Dyadobacter sp. 3J3]